MTPYLYTFVELQFVDNIRNHDKYYRGYLDHQDHEIQFQYGKNGYGNHGSWTDPVTYETLSEANDAMMKQIQKKVAKGYSVTRTLLVTCARKADREVLAQEIGFVVARRQFDDSSPLIIANV